MLNHQNNNSPISKEVGEFMEEYSLEFVRRYPDWLTNLTPGRDRPLPSFRRLSSAFEKSTLCTGL